MPIILTVNRTANFVFDAIEHIYPEQCTAKSIAEYIAYKNDIPEKRTARAVNRILCAGTMFGVFKKCDGKYSLTNSASVESLCSAVSSCTNVSTACISETESCGSPHKNWSYEVPEYVLARDCSYERRHHRKNESKSKRKRYEVSEAPFPDEKFWKKHHSTKEHHHSNKKHHGRKHHRKRKHHRSRKHHSRKRHHSRREHHSSKNHHSIKKHHSHRKRQKKKIRFSEAEPEQIEIPQENTENNHKTKPKKSKRKRACSCDSKYCAKNAKERKTELEICASDDIQETHFENDIVSTEKCSNFGKDHWFFPIDISCIF